MNTKTILLETFVLSEAEGNSLLLIDIDDTLLKAKGIFIRRKLPSDSKVVKLTPEQYAKDPNTKKPENRQYYDYSDFRDKSLVQKSIEQGKPLLGNLRLIDKYIANGWDIGILTARGMEDAIYESIKKFLMYRSPPETGELIAIGDKLKRNRVFAVNDEKKKYKGNTDAEKKANVMLELLNKYNRVYLIDDDAKNLKNVETLAEVKKLRNRLKAIKAKEE